jgi:hypothetical protein
LQLDRRCWPSWASIAGRGGASFAGNSHSCGPRLTERWHHRSHSWLRSAPCCDRLCHTGLAEPGAPRACRACSCFRSTFRIRSCPILRE